MAFHRWASDGSAGLSRHVRASILRLTAAEAPRMSRRTMIQITGGFFLPPSPASLEQPALRYQVGGATRGGGEGLEPGPMLLRRARWECLWPVTCESELAPLTARARWEPAVSDAVRTQRGPAWGYGRRGMAARTCSMKALLAS